ncbi:ATP-binding protein [Nitrospira sp. NS4]|uniref:sensor histidine kinase n=1 Tax=Nitrospira sp. NS4 TaxID=3414498 RepID=UPI003C2BB4A3
MRARWFEGILSWVMIAGIALVGLAIVLISVLDTQIIEQAGANNLHAEFLRAAASVSRIISKSGDIHDVAAVQEAFQDIFELRPGIRRLSVFDVSTNPGARIYSSDPASAPTTLPENERNEIAAGRSVAHFDLEGTDRGWLITAPIIVNGQVVGALRGRFSLWKYDGLIRQQRRLAQHIGVGAVLTTSLVFLALIHFKIHRPIGALLRTMRRAESGDLSSTAPLKGPADIQELSRQFNRMLDRVREALAIKERLLGEIEGFNDTLTATVAQTKEELHRANLLLVEARIQTERTSKLAALGELSAVMAHELGNPLNAIGGHLQLLQKEIAAPDSLRHISIVRAEIGRMIAIIQHILDSTRMEIRPVPVDLNAVVHDVHRLIAPTLSDRRIAWKSDLAHSLHSVAGDRRALHGVIFNLATNAIQAMPNGGELEIVTTPCIEDGPAKAALFHGAGVRGAAVRLTLRDSGYGIAPEHLPHIFQPFFTTRQQDGGTGLGLAICQRVILSLGGRIGVESVVGHGTQFIIDLPHLDRAGEEGGTYDR